MKPQDEMVVGNANDFVVKSIDEVPGLVKVNLDLEIDLGSDGVIKTSDWADIERF